MLLLLIMVMVMMLSVLIVMLFDTCGCEMKLDLKLDTRHAISTRSYRFGPLKNSLLLWLMAAPVVFYCCACAYAMEGAASIFV